MKNKTIDIHRLLHTAKRINELMRLMQQEFDDFLDAAGLMCDKNNEIIRKEGE